RINFKGEDEVSPVLSNINSGVSSLSSRIEDSGKVFSKINRALLAGFTAIATGVTVLGAKAIKSFAEFDQHIKRVQVLAGGTADDFNKLSETALRLGSSTAFSAIEVSDAFEEFARSGFKVNQILDSTEATLGLATVANTSLADAVSTTVNILNIFQRDAQDTTNIANTLTTTFTNSAQSLNDLGEALRIVGPLASNLGISLEELSAALGAMAQAGIKGSLAGSSLNSALMQLLKPGDKTATVMDELGVQFFTFNDSAKAANAIIQASKEEFSALKDNVKQSDIEVAKIGARLAEAKRQLKEFGNNAAGVDSLKNKISGLQDTFDSARLRNKELKDSLDAQYQTLSNLREQVRAGQEEFVGLRDSAKMLNEAFDNMNASKIERASKLIELFEVRGAKSFLALTKQVDDFEA
ncbi:MAG: phage tail tape measure protein, partial [Candidatus Woesearchaeota archaeon]|nr:phage tail tape measure protein [Candidatus Woesearchaeota archaeon]